MHRSYPLPERVSLTGLLFPIALLAPYAGMAQKPVSVSLPPAIARLAAEFSDLTAIRELRDGRVLLFDRKETRFVVADLSSGRVRDVARTGQGPAEFQHISALVPLEGDSTLAADVVTTDDDGLQCLSRHPWPSQRLRG
ncbi:MAG TPA: hypothetical protein VF178_04100 [Gemmatimonadaceae bacterium]